MNEVAPANTDRAHWHGTENGYTNRGCHCQPCRDAHAGYTREKRNQPINPALCPSLLNYLRRCRCDGCRELHNRTRRESDARARNKAAGR